MDHDFTVYYDRFSIVLFSCIYIFGGIENFLSSLK